MSFPMLDLFEQVIIKTFGSTTTFAFILIAIFIILFLFAGLDFRISGLIVMPLFMGFAAIGWLPEYVNGLAWIILVGFGLFIMWNWIRER